MFPRCGQGRLLCCHDANHPRSQLCVLMQNKGEQDIWQCQQRKMTPHRSLDNNTPMLPTAKPAHLYLILLGIGLADTTCLPFETLLQLEIARFPF